MTFNEASGCFALFVFLGLYEDSTRNFGIDVVVYVASRLPIESPSSQTAWALGLRAWDPKHQLWTLLLESFKAFQVSV